MPPSLSPRPCGFPPSLCLGDAASIPFPDAGQCSRLVVWCSLPGAAVDCGLLLTVPSLSWREGLEAEKRTHAASGACTWAQRHRHLQGIRSQGQTMMIRTMFSWTWDLPDALSLSRSHHTGDSTVNKGNLASWSLSFPSGK